MISEQDKPVQIQDFRFGVNQDMSPDGVFSQEKSGFYIDGHNVQPTSNDNNTGDLERIKGEELLYGNMRNDTGYQCMASATVNGKLVEIWAPANPTFPGIIRVDGVVVLSSEDFNLSPDLPLQWDVNDSRVSGEIAFTDKNQVPFVFNIQDMVDNILTDKYFANFDPKLYQVNIQSALDIPVFIELVNVGGGGGLPVGHYQYQIRAASSSGDRTQWSHPTPMIPVMQSFNSDSAQYPWVKTFGGPPNPSSVTSLAPRIRFRVTNLYDYDYIEIKRISYNNGAGIDYTSNGIIVARVDIAAGEISVRDYIDPQESNVSVALSAEDESRQLAHIETAGSVKYFDRRLVFGNITYPSRESNLQFLEINEKQGFPIIDKIYKEGYNDPYNHTYKQSQMRGETRGFGAVCYDAVGNKGYVQKAEQLKSYTFPNRRDAVATETANYSYNGTARAALTDSTNAVGQTHEVFDLVDRVFKSDNCDFKNITEKGRVFGATGTKLVSPFGVTQDCDETIPEIENHGANVSAGLVSVSYQPFTPVNQNDADVTGHNYVVNTKVSVSPVIRPIEGEGVVSYRPAGFAPDYYAMGLMVAGVANFPEWAKAFAIVQTPPARRVIAQGLAYYSLVKGKFRFLNDENLGGKETKKFWFYAPDIENGIVSSDTVNDIIANPNNYKLQFVSPLGFFSEWYSAEDKFQVFATEAEKDRCIDMISYVRMLCDNQGPNSNINPSEHPEMGIDGGDGNRYIAYDKFRNLTVIPSTFSGDPAGGNKLFSITGVTRRAEGRGTYLEVEVDQDVYASPFTGGMADSDFEDNGLKNWTEPVYVVNIVRTGADINDNDLEKYQQTTNYQKLESIIGKSTGLPDQVFPLVDERWDDCIPSPRAGQYGSSTNRYIYIKNLDGTVEKWVNVTYMTVVQKANVLADISAGIGDIKGIYTHTNVGNRDRFFEINFNQSGFYPSEGSLILVRYDNTAPIRVFGGDTFIGETIFAPIDGQASARDNAAETQFAMGIGLPYKQFKINPRYYTIRKAGAGVNSIQDAEWFSLGFIRQLCVMFTVESRSAIHLAYNGSYPNQFFPLINYVIRPNRWDVDKNEEDNYIFSDYRDDYGAEERGIWKWGGFRFLQQINPDYSTTPPIAFFSRPQIGFEEKLSFPTRFMWSLPRQINVQGTPGIKTFPANNSFDIDDNQGEITYMWVSTTGAGDNIYGITERGICMALTKKSILSDLGANQLGVIAADSFIGGQYWISRDIGIPDKMWRAAADTYVPVQGGTRKALFFINLLSVYRLMDNRIEDISDNYYNRLYKDGITTILPGVQTKMCSIYDLYKDQLYIHIDNGEQKITFAYSQENGKWFGTNDFTFDRFTSYNGEAWGHRDMKTYKLNVGDQINGELIEARVVSAFAPDSEKEKEFIRINVNSDQRPVHVKFYKKLNGTEQCSLTITKGPLYLKRYDGWQNDVPRIDAVVDVKRSRFQARLIIYEIMFNLAGSFVITDVEMSYKKII